MSSAQQFFASRRYYDPKETFEKQLTFAQVVEYLGRDVRPTFLPSDLHAIDVKDMSFTMIYKKRRHHFVRFYRLLLSGNTWKPRL